MGSKDIDWMFSPYHPHSQLLRGYGAGKGAREEWDEELAMNK